MKRLDVTPPGHPLRIITPTASSPFKPNRSTRLNATHGSSSTWAMAPATKARGCTTASLKSSGRSVMPSVNMMNASPRESATAIIKTAGRAQNLLNPSSRPIRALHHVWPRSCTEDRRLNQQRGARFPDRWKQLCDRPIKTQQQKAPPPRWRLSDSTEAESFGDFSLSRWRELAEPQEWTQQQPGRGGSCERCARASLPCRGWRGSAHQPRCSGRGPDHQGWTG